jgi:hypothetical protein
MTTPDELRAAIARLGCGKDRAATMLGMSGRTLRAMCAGTELIRPYVMFALEYLFMSTEISVSNEMLADHLTADFGYWLAVRSDGSHYLIEGSASHRGHEYIAAVKCPGIGNLDATVFADGFAEYGDDGIYRTADGSFEGDLDTLIRHTCEHGDVTGFVEDLEAALQRSALVNITE